MLFQIPFRFNAGGIFVDLNLSLQHPKDKGNKCDAGPRHENQEEELARKELMATSLVFGTASQSAQPRKADPLFKP